MCVFSVPALYTPTLDKVEGDAVVYLCVDGSGGSR